MSFSLRALVLALGLITAPLLAAAKEPSGGTLELDPSKTSIEFRLSGTLHTTHGSFKLVRGTIAADVSTGEASGLISVDAASGGSAERLRDERMRDGVLEAQKYPEITFTPQHISGHRQADGSFEAKLEGIMKLHGDPHQIEIPVNGRIAGDSVTAAAHFSVPYVEWGLKDPSILFFAVAKQVDIDVDTQGHVSWASKGGRLRHSSDSVR